MKKVAVVILNYKARENTLKCADSVKKSDYENLEIIVVDNNSGDGLAEEIKKVVGVIFIQNKDNLGYSGGNNVGIKKALEDEAEYVFILNMDTVIDKKAITQLVIAIEENQAGVLGPKILFFDKKTIWYAGGTLDLNNVLGGHRGVDEEDHGQYEKIEETDNVTGGAMFVKSDIFVKIGLFDERYFLYYEDSDFCFRAKRAGFKLMYVPTAVIYHENAKSTGLGSPRQDYFITRNRMLFASKFLPFRTRFALFRETLRNIAISTKRLALIDFLRGNWGKGSF
ncbi:MAG: Glycosyl transferase family 2 [Candidatus Daviesbacteria bacterium GW2011_GWA1_41_61]|uniref:Glycosyl transferase family 2 n=1 Tax=Candidatus Daviesbacteria bacterium GW2011_GWA2_40_9 TaxID=1618424 RepID=A0A0G0U0F0_9BACT|nr:MAG: Glycosyl transferase family 2 [Candidatus Daviesbacteria bacterium GW2011_GWA2_40_9]KKR93015.1 MAG: Glycosyl transferase family 2 [Candidatus Daviesbacteria bacterium GW2011_GWB1_41_15]KKS15559.1 MAG: Glycosyl transferase family 2 [Candidatus Daviesbacteria bacterium GW2011_GWA1_41_61]